MEDHSLGRSRTTHTTDLATVRTDGTASIGDESCKSKHSFGTITNSLSGNGDHNQYNVNSDSYQAFGTYIQPR